MSKKDFKRMGRRGVPQSRPEMGPAPSDQEALAAGIREAMAQVRAGETIPAEDIEAWVESWDTSNERPMPVSRRH